MAKRKKKVSRKISESKFKWWHPFKYIGVAVWFPLKYLGKGVYYLYSAIYDSFSRKQKKVSKGEIKSKNPVSDIRVVETFKGSYRSFWSRLSKSDSLIGIILGARGSGKSAIALSLIENLRGGGKNFFAMGFSKKEMPDWIKVIGDVNEIENDSYVIIDEGGILFSARESMSTANKLLSELLFIARHKSLTIFFISQNSSSLEINTLRQADFLVLKRSSLLQKNFERKIIADIYEEYNDSFAKHPGVKGLALIYSDSFVGFIDNDLPSFWSVKVSKSFR